MTYSAAYGNLYVELNDVLSRFITAFRKKPDTKLMKKPRGIADHPLGFLSSWSQQLFDNMIC